MSKTKFKTMQKVAKVYLKYMQKVAKILTNFLIYDNNSTKGD